jgi:hypothetical protein
MTEEWFILWLLYYQPLLFKVWQRSGSCCCWYIVYHYYSTFDRGVAHVVVVILHTITVYGMTEDWFMLWLLYCLPLLFNVWQRSGSCCCCYIVYHCCLMLTVEWFMLLLLYCLSLLLKVWQRSDSCCYWLYCLPVLFKVWQRSGSCCCCYILYHYCLRFDREVVHVVNVILSTITVEYMTEEWFMLLLVVMSNITV